jgi:hypothetical protein
MEGICCRLTRPRVCTEWLPLRRPVSLGAGALLSGHALIRSAGC